MAKFTCYLDDLLRSGFDLGLEDYPIWNEDHRSVLNTKILNHYRFYEIGFETPAMFKFYLNKTMYEIMPYYIKLHETTQYTYNPIYVADYTEEIDTDRSSKDNVSQTSTGSSQTQNNSSGNSTMNLDGTITKDNDVKELSSDTPQNLIEVPTIETAQYASEIKFNKTGGSEKTESEQTNTSTQTDNATSSGETNLQGENTGESTEKMVKRLYGNYGAVSTQSLIEKERNLIVNIDLMIIDRLRDLFMLIY